MFIKPENLTTEQINEICEKLWKEELLHYSDCPDCGVNPNQQHLNNCDVARCTICGRQKLGCDCEKGENDIWEGIWPGIKKCYENKLICFDTVTLQWMFNL
jgi:hypothetical protein